MEFEYQALNRTGTVIRNTIAVNNVSQVYVELKRMGLIPVRISPAVQTETVWKRYWGQILKKSGYSNEPDPRRAQQKHLPFFTTQMAIMLQAGTQLADVLNALEQQMACPHWKALAAELYRQVREGGNLASAMNTYSNVFDKIYVSMIAAGEKSGKMVSILNQLAAFSQRADRLRNKIISAMIYPLVLSMIAVGVLVVLLFFVLPRFENIFLEMKVNLPASTKMLLTVSAALRTNMVLSLAGLAGTIVGIVYWLRSAYGRRLIARTALRLPVIGLMIKSVQSARIMRLIGLLVEANVPLVDSLDLTRQACSNYLFRDMMQDVYDSVVNGHSMYEVMQSSGIMDSSVVQMVRTGEENSQIGQVTTMLAGYLDDRNETQIGMLTHIMEPLILVLMGTVIGGLAISLILPMFDLSQISA